MKLSRKQKALTLMFLDSLFIIFSAFFTYSITEGLFQLSDEFYFLVVVIPILIYLLLGLRYDLFKHISRYTSIYEIIRIFLLITASFVLTYFIILIFIQRFNYQYILLTYTFSVLLIPSARILWRIFHEYKNGYFFRENPKVKKIRTLIVGAGDGGNFFIDNLMKHPNEIEIIGIVDKDLSKLGSMLYNFPVLGQEKDIPELVEKYDIDQVTIAIPTVKPLELARIIEYCASSNVQVNQMPSIRDILSGKLSIQRFRTIDVVDLLGREEVQLEESILREQLQGRVILVSGAGGSIGSEICRQVSKFNPKKIILLGHGENSIYNIDMELNHTCDRSIEIVPVIADVQDRERIFKVMAKFKPDQVYHAAAHKHVPLMEYNPTEAIKNNIFGSKNMAEAAKAAGVKSFVMVSTDKAVRPTNVMGSTKRIAEMIVTALNEEGCTKFAAVRFGNVLGSRGSVIPVFREQIEKGGPVTITDFRMIRYFMTIPEASRLVIQAGVLAKGGEIFILDMGQPVKIYDLAKKMIKLSGLTEDEIPITETGIRPGEKLYEELLVDGQLAENQVYEKIFVGQGSKHCIEETLAFVESLEDKSEETIRQEIIKFANLHQ